MGSGWFRVGLRWFGDTEGEAARSNPGCPEGIAVARVATDAICRQEPREPEGHSQNGGLAKATP